ncbi:HU family DNA-binding protein [Celeribacter indicus]|uniref:DNA-binding protein HU n=1 Tax=Celeribacter indicus TaxID=1208324 RepID=A0A0B5DX97_9RHOB|nr:HU family DNA-binding protein [Celeribacter indicus]AJE47629.1 DNA-binding protein HU [Celeribacter indicus]SDW12439.1 DNA-binding protein [Celeribacter indicus]
MATRKTSTRTRTTTQGKTATEAGPADIAATPETGERTGPAKAAAPAAAGVKPAPKITLPDSTPAAPVEAPKATVVMKKKEMIAKVAEASGVKRGDAKKAMEATLALLGEALQSGQKLDLPPLGKLSIKNQRESSGAHIIVTKLRRPKGMLETAEAAASGTAGTDDAEDAAES